MRCQMVSNPIDGCVNVNILNFSSISQDIKGVRFFCHSIYEIIFHPAPLFSYKIKALENTRETSTAQSHLSKRTSTSVPLFALTLCLGRTDTESTANQLSILPPPAPQFLFSYRKYPKAVVIPFTKPFSMHAPHQEHENPVFLLDWNWLQTSPRSNYPMCVNNSSTPSKWWRC